jgi:hypothetical protein
MFVVLVAGSTAMAEPDRPSPRERQCRFQWVDEGTWTTREEELTTDCILDRWDVPGGESVFDCIIARESGWNRMAYNPAGPYLGLGQHVASAWGSRVAAYEPFHWELRERWPNSRTQITVTARMMHALGTSGVLQHWPGTSRACGLG